MSRNARSPSFNIERDIPATVLVMCQMQTPAFTRLTHDGLPGLAYVGICLKWSKMTQNLEIMEKMENMEIVKNMENMEIMEIMENIENLKEMENMGISSLQ
jgi:hypothetical protein